MLCSALASLCKLVVMALRNFERPTPSFLVAAGYGLLGSAFLVEAVRLGIQIRDAKKSGGGVGGVGSRRRRGQLGWAANENDETVEQARSRTRGAVTSAKIREVATIEERLDAIKGLTIKSSLDPRIREDSLAIVSRKCGPDGKRSWCVPEKDWWGEVKAIFASFRDPNSFSAVRYVRDHPEVDQFTLAGKTLFRLRAGDCLPGETLLMTPKGFVPIAEIRVGDVVMGDGAWVKVTRWWDKGVLPTRSLSLNTGSTLRCTDDHRLFSVPVIAAGARPGLRASAVEVAASEIEEGHQLLTGSTLPMGRERLSEGKAWLLGVHIADGWVEYDGSGAPYRVRISGKDGQPKEAQKRRVEAVCAELGWSTTWAERFITINSREAAEWLAPCGRCAPEKKLPKLDFDLATVRSILEGLAADASVSNTGTVTYNTTSEELALQIRVLHRMLGQRTNIRRVDEHGGLGSHPIYRVSAIQQGRYRHAIVQEVQENFVEEHVFDIEVEGHRFWLPEHDLVVHNCDDQAIALAARLRSIGYPVAFRVIRAKGAPTWSHIYVMVGLPPTGPTKWVPLDTTVPGAPPGWEAPANMIQAKRDFPL